MFCNFAFLTADLNNVLDGFSKISNLLLMFQVGRRFELDDCADSESYQPTI
jgi:hypothetical protein